MTKFAVSSGIISSGLTINPGDSLLVYAGGIAVSTTDSGITDVYGLTTFTLVEAVGGSAVETIHAGGSSFATALSAVSGGQAMQIVEQGGIAVRTIIGFGATQMVAGVSSDASVNGLLEVSSGGLAISAAGGTVVVLAGGSAAYTQAFQLSVYGTASATELNMTSETVFSGGVESGASLGQFAQQTLSGGTAIGVSVGYSSQQYVLSGGLAISTTLAYEGVHTAAQLVGFGGLAISTQVVGGYESVISGGVTSDSYVTNSGTESISSGGIAVNTIVGGQALLGVGSGGLVSMTTVQAGGFLNVSGVAAMTLVDGAMRLAGTAYLTTIGSGGAETVLAGAYDQGATITAGGVQTISGGAAVDAVISTGGVQLVLSGGLASGTGLVGQTGGTALQDVGAGASASVTVVENSGAVQMVRAGAVTTGTAAGGGGREDVAGLAIDSFMDAGGLLTVEQGGVTAGAVINSGGMQTVSSGGTASGTEVDPGGVLFVLSGGTADATVVTSGGLFVALGGTAVSGTTVQPGGSAVLTGVVTSGPGGLSVDGPVASGQIVASGTTQYVLSGGSAIAEVISGVQKVFGGGLASGNSVEHGVLDVLSGGVATATAVNSGLLDVSSGGSAVGTTIFNGGGLTVEAGGLISSTVVNFELVVSGTALNTTINGNGVAFVVGHASGVVVDGGSFIVSGSGATANSVTINSGGSATISSGGTLTGGVVNNLGLSFVYSGGVESGLILNSGGVDRLIGGTDIGVLVASGGFEIVSSGGVDIAPVVQSGGFLAALPGSVVSGALVQPGGAVISTGVVLNRPGLGISAFANVSGLSLGSADILYVLPGGSAVDTMNGGFEKVFSGGVAISTTVQAAGAEYLYAGATASGLIVQGTAQVGVGAVVTDTLLSGGVMDVVGLALNTNDVIGGDFVSGVASGTVIGSGAFEQVVSAGLSVSAIVGNGGSQQAFFGGTASAATIQSGGQQFSYSGGSAVGTVILDGGQQIVGASGLAQGAQIQSGGLQIVLDSGDARSTTIHSGGLQQVIGGIAVVTTVESGATVSVGVGAQLAGAVVLSGGVAAVRGEATNALVSGQMNLSGGGAVNNVVEVGGRQTLFAGGRAQGTNILSGGLELVQSAGIATFERVSSGGTQDVQSGASVSTTSIFDAGLQVVESGGFVTDTRIASGGSMIVHSGAIANLTTIDNGGTAVIEAGGTLVGAAFYAGGMIDLVDFAYVSGGSATISQNKVLTVSEGGAARQLQLIDYAASASFFLTGDGKGGTLIGERGTPCYCRGTLIAVEGGEVAVEDLAIGDLVRTMAGGLRPIRWIGRRGYDGRFAASNVDVLPIRIAAGALANGVPRRDLFVSPNHAMFLDGVLIPAFALVNGASVTRVQRVDSVEYFHVELASHDVLLAEGALAESFIDDRTRLMFVNAAEHAALYPEALAVTARYCAERVTEGAQLEAVRAKIAARTRPAGQGLALADCGPLQGSVDVLTRARVAGWAFDEARPDEAVRLQLLVDGAVLMEIVANGYRRDLEQAGLAYGRHGFDVPITPLEPGLRHVVALRRAEDGALLAGAMVLEPADLFDATLEATIHDAVCQTAGRGRDAEILCFLAVQAERLRQAASQRPGSGSTLQALVVETGPALADALRRVRGLVALGYAVSYVAADRFAAEPIVEPGVVMCGAPFYASVEEVMRRALRPFDLIVLEGADAALRYGALARHYHAQARIVGTPLARVG